MGHRDELVEKYGHILLDRQQPLKKRFRALFGLKNLGGFDAINLIGKCFSDPSALLKHELAYCLGQMNDKRAVNILKDVLRDENENAMVRHEAGEALGAIGEQSCIDLLKEYASDKSPEVSETCQLALSRINWAANRDLSSDESEKSLFSTIDPAPPTADAQDVEQLKHMLINPLNSLWDRYRAMFKLRDLNSEDSILVLADGLKCEDSALFRHEIAFVLGQLQSPLAVRQLIDRLSLAHENPMVRHECAEALGSIGTENCRKILNDFLDDPEIVVRESCIVALDICDYNDSDEFQYASMEVPESSTSTFKNDETLDCQAVTASTT
uniref:Deoxyhypusine hydroxylase n=1 Tax=Romanomermis culicivorax TaxID=13658 RepID=A0A915IMI3_ROMCU